MQRPEKLTPHQKSLLAKYEPLLQQSALRGDIEKAKEYCAQIIQILRPTGHETRILQNKIWLCEALLEAGQLDTAIRGLIGIQKKTNINTIVHLEAVSLLAICHIKKQDLQGARGYIAHALQNDHVFTSQERRKNFRLALIKRLDEEAIIASISRSSTCTFSHDDIQRDAGNIVRNNTEDEIFSLIGEATPPSTLKFLREVHELSKRQLPFEERLSLPHPPDKDEPRRAGRKVFTSLSRVVYKSLCDKNNDVYKAWYTNGISGLLNKKLLVPAILSAVCGFQSGVYTLAVSTTALVIKLGIDVYCDLYEPDRIMDVRPQRKLR